MAINIVCTSKPIDGLFYYSYEYCSLLNARGIPAKLVVICHRNFCQQDYLDVIEKKYIHCKDIQFDSAGVDCQDLTLIMGRSMMTLSFFEFDRYRIEQQNDLKYLFSRRLISVYSENHPADYPNAVNFYQPAQIIDLCDTEVYPKGQGQHFEKTINFEIYRPHVDAPQFKYLFLGTNKKYYETVQKTVGNYPDHGILTYQEDYVDPKNNNIFVPVDNLMGLFETYVYTKETFDPAPRIIQECKYFGKQVIYHRDKSIVDGGSVYWKRDLKVPDITAIQHAMKELT